MRKSYRYTFPPRYTRSIFYTSRNHQLILALTLRNIRSSLRRSLCEAQQVGQIVKVVAEFISIFSQTRLLHVCRKETLLSISTVYYISLRFFVLPFLVDFISFWCRVIYNPKRYCSRVLPFCSKLPSYTNCRAVQNRFSFEQLRPVVFSFTFEPDVVTFVVRWILFCEDDMRCVQYKCPVQCGSRVETVSDFLNKTSGGSVILNLFVRLSLKLRYPVF